MSEELCGDCASLIADHKENQIQTLTSHIMMLKVAESLEPEYADTLKAILIDWRTHTLPTCDPLAID
jgi:hypothetical protein